MHLHISEIKSVHWFNIISDEQTGFFQERQFLCNVRSVLNTIYSEPSAIPTEAILLLHGDTAFDCVESNCLFAVLRWFGLGEEFTSWKPLLCTSIHTNNIHPNVVSLSRSNFNLAFTNIFQTFPYACRENVVENRIWLYADDPLVYVSKTRFTRSIPAIQSFIKRYWSTFGHKANVSKTECNQVHELVPALKQSDRPSIFGDKDNQNNVFLSLIERINLIKNNFPQTHVLFYFLFCRTSKTQIQRWLVCSSFSIVRLSCRCSRDCLLLHITYQQICFGASKKQPCATTSLQALLNSLIPTNYSWFMRTPVVSSTLRICCQFSWIHFKFTSVYPVSRKPFI